MLASQNRLAIWIALRYLLARGSALSYVSRLALLGLALSVAVLVLVLSVVNGFERELRERVLALLPQVTATAYQPMLPGMLSQLEQQSRPADLLAVAPFVEGTVLLSVRGQIKGVTLTGIDPGSYREVTDLRQHVGDGSLQTLERTRFSLILGQRVAADLQVDVGDDVLVVLPGGSLSPAGAIPRQRRFTVVDLLRSDSQLDSQAAYTSLPAAQSFFRTGRGVHGMHVRVEDLFQLDGVVNYLRTVWGEHQIRISTWMRNFGNLYQAIAVQKLTMFLLLSFLVGVASFNLVSGLMMIVEQRRHDIAVLRTLGASSTAIVVLFCIVGVMLAAFGIGVGLAVGGALAALLPGLFAWLSTELTLDLMSQYFISYLPTDLRVADFVNVGVAALILAVVAVIFPARRAAKLLPSQVLAHE